MQYAAAAPQAAVPLSTDTTRASTLVNSRWLNILLCGTMALGSAVLVEPAPIDLALVFVFGVAALAGTVSLHQAHRLPMVLGAGFLLANLVSLPNSVDWQRGIWYFAVTGYLVASLIIFGAISTACGRPAMTAMLNGYVFAGLVSAALGIAAYFDVLPYRSLLLLNGRVKGLFKDPNVYGPYLVPIVVYSLAIVQDRARTSAKLIWGAIAVLSMGGVFLSFSRACWFNCAVALATALALTTVQSRSMAEVMRRVSIALVVLAAIGGGILLITASIPEVSSMLSIRLGQSGLQNYDAMRFQTHSRAIEAAIDEPLGIGPGQSEIVFQYAVHSLYLRVFSENGWLGVISFFGLVLVTVFRSMRISLVVQDPYWRRIFTVAAACLVGLLANSVVIDSIHWRHFFFLLGIAWAAPLEMFQFHADVYSQNPGVARSTDHNNLSTVDCFGGYRW